MHDDAARGFALLQRAKLPGEALYPCESLVYKCLGFENAQNSDSRNLSSPSWKQFKINRLACIERGKEEERQGGKKKGRRGQNIWILSKKKRQA